MAVTMAKRSGRRFAAGLSALALGAALLAMPGTALAQQDEHRHDGNRGGNAAPREQPARPGPAAPARPAQAPTAPAARGDYERGPARDGGQYRPAPGNPGGNGWQGRGPQANGAPGQPYQGQGRPGDAGRPFTGQFRNDGGAGRNNGDQGRNDRGDWRGNGNGNGNGGQWQRDGGPGRYDGGRGGYGYGYGRPQPGGQWNHGWRQDNRYDWRGWRDQNRDAFHVGRYYPPYRDYSYNRLGIGFYLQPMFFGSDYWIADPFYYHLPPAYGPYHWVRYYNDVILVNVYNGEVADVIYDFFW